MLNRKGRMYKMVAPLDVFTVDEQQAVIGFFGWESVKPREIYRRMLPQYGDAVLSREECTSG